MKQQRPLILILPGTQRRGFEFGDLSMSLSDCYTRAIVAAGGIPWVLPVDPDPAMADEAVQRADGVMLTGGDDIGVGLYARKVPGLLRSTLSRPSPLRDWVELRIIDAVFRLKRPLLAICRGCQILNVALGGSLIIDIATQLPDALNHRRSDQKDRLVHDILLDVDSELAACSGVSALAVNSAHHQAIGRVAPLFQVVARSPDQVIEAIELKPGHRRCLPFLIGVQYHPERLFDRHPVHLELFKAFVAAARGGTISPAPSRTWSGSSPRSA